MTKSTDSRIVLYPQLGAYVDLWFSRLAGHGLGNCFYCYFHAIVLAEQANGIVIAPPWFSLKLGPLLRGESSKRLYWRMFKPFANEISGFGKLFRLLAGFPRRNVVEVGMEATPVLRPGVLNVVVVSTFTFNGLHSYLDLIRRRLLGIIRDPIPVNFAWGRGSYIAVHVRLGDFAKVGDATVVSSGQPNTRIPLSWYVSVVSALRQRFAEREIYIFSDGQPDELRPLLTLGAQLYRSGSDITDLLAMSGASILVGSNSTYSRWAAFLGDMPSIWLKKTVEDEKPTGSETPILFVGMDDSHPELWPQHALRDQPR